MSFRARLAQTLVDESRAYGYTLVIWGAGAMLIAEYGVPSSPAVLAYITGSLLGFAAVTYYAFGGVLTAAEESARDVKTAAEMVHLAATFCNLVVAIALVTLFANTPTPEIAAFGVVGFQATVGYSVLLVAEEVLGERLQ
ncbi:hypothetical protein [Salarchaeum sp. JOR-1]|uniref:hypothetical protein n=1 Tax=Salarchaeum sp. JOR-1 TaxID=2599399 RepID=UPI001198525B|nr:hypothetical protein [Salarchaeum sp. JOR-1]QDX40165.1 hypothetical protein FQU85_04380 [Salarchaeum sp. JOR-1]